MNRHRTICLSSGLLLNLGFVTPALAEDVPVSGQGANARLANQAARSSAGIHDGSLNRREARRLQNSENHIRAERERFEADEISLPGNGRRWRGTRIGCPGRFASDGTMLSGGGSAPPLPQPP